jgi:hypothetical protein
MEFYPGDDPTFDSLAGIGGQLRLNRLPQGDHAALSFRNRPSSHTVSRPLILASVA